MWLKIIRCQKFARPFEILMSAHWMRGFTQTIDCPQQIQTILKVTGNDMRRTALQYQVAKGPDGLLDSCEHFFLSIPRLVCEHRTDKEKREWYSVFCDTVIWADFDFPFFKKYMRGYGERLFSAEREMTFWDRAEMISEKLPCSNRSDFDCIEMMTLAFFACKHATAVTGDASIPVISGQHSLTPIDVEDIVQWDFWPRLEKEVKLGRSCSMDLAGLATDFDVVEMNRKPKKEPTSGHKSRRGNLKKKSRKRKEDSDSEWLPS
jgi:hypothetical protein